MAFTKVAPAGIGSTPGDGYRIGDSFLHSTGVELTNINATGILTAASLDISGAIDFDGHTELDNVNISGVSTFTGNIDANGDLDVDGHTELDNGNVSGVVTFTNSPNAIQMNDNARVSFGNSLKTSISYDSSSSRTKIRNYNDTLEIGYRNTEIYHSNVARLKFDSGNAFTNAVNTTFAGDNYHAVWIPSSNMFRLNDNAKLAFGSQTDATIYHNNANLLISNTTGNINVTGGNVNVSSGHINVSAGYSFQWGDSHERIEQSDGKIEFFTNNGEKMTLDGNNLGIGTNNPLQRLHVKQGSTTTPAMVEALGAQSHVKFQHNAGSSYTTTIGSKTLGAGNVGLTFNTGTSGGGTKMTIDVNGRIGIGTELPQTMHHLFGSSGLYTRFESAQGQVNFGNSNGAGVIHVTSTSQPLKILVNGSNERLRITSDGKVGINDNSPAANLSVKPTAGHCSAQVISGDGTTIMNGTSVQGIEGRFGMNSNHPLAIYTNGLERARIDTNGIVTKPYQPSFHARLINHTNATQNPLIYDDVIVNVGSHYKTSGSDAGKFVAPVAGTYFFFWEAIKNNLNGSVTRLYLMKNGSKTYNNMHLRLQEEGSYANGCMNVVMTLAVGDKIHIQLSVGGVHGSEYTHFGGYLIG